MAYARKYLTTIERMQATPSTAYARLFDNNPGPFRIMPLGRHTVNYGWAAHMGLHMITGYEPYNLRHYQQYVALMRTGRARQADAVVWTDVTGLARWDLLDRLNVGYVLSAVPIHLPSDRFELVAEFPDQPAFVSYQGMTRTAMLVYRNRHALPRVFWAQRVLPVSGEMKAVSAIQRVWLERLEIVEGIQNPLDAPPVSADERAVVVDIADGHLTVDTDARTTRFLVVSEIWHPGWKGTLDGQDLPLYRADLALMGAWIPAGKHRLVLEFRPLYWSTGLGITILSGAVILMGLIWVYWFRHLYRA
jgi:hypothetical protein